MKPTPKVKISEIIGRNMPGRPASAEPIDRQLLSDRVARRQPMLELRPGIGKCLSLRDGQAVSSRWLQRYRRSHRTAVRGIGMKLPRRGHANLPEFPACWGPRIDMANTVGDRPASDGSRRYI